MPLVFLSNNRTLDLILVSLLEAAKAHETLNDLVETEAVHWQTLTCFHFTQAQIDKHRVRQKHRLNSAFRFVNHVIYLNLKVNGIISWRHLFFELKKYYGLREVDISWHSLECLLQMRILVLDIRGPHTYLLPLQIVVLEGLFYCLIILSHSPITRASKFRDSGTLVLV